MEIKKNFASLQPREVNVVFDRDNTLNRLFNKGDDVASVLSHIKEKGFFLNKPLNDPEAPEVLRLLSVGFGFNLWCCTKATDSPFFKKETLEWNQRYFSDSIPQKRVVIVRADDNRSKAEVLREDFAVDISRSILVDDFGENLSAWEQAGGYAIKKSYSGKPRSRDFIVNFSELVEKLTALLRP